ncbi:MAG TPA: formimidoylglutamate deiminase [Gammaproteobacteria bacterium]|nr:formimidoylglutamate deiminase [Gammaproteobacteria bacterium]
MTSRLTFQYVLTPNGIERDRTLQVDEAGTIAAIEPASGPADGFFALPGMPNAHSHAFQRALAGFAEARLGGDSFWSWREAMYRLANRVTPDDTRIIARQAFADMLRGGYTTVAEFHYLHGLPDGRHGADMAEAVIDAAAETGIRLTLLPVLYQNGSFEQAAQPEQRRFVHASLDDYLGLLECLRGSARLGIAPHSLRAVPAAQLPALIRAARDLLGPDCPIHIHISEQTGEVEQCREHYGTTPIDWLARHATLDGHWNLVHATHATADESRLIRHADANVVLCPLTEAYLGDGLFAAGEHVANGGRIAIGSDSNIRADAIEELRWLEFGQRLADRKRARLATPRGLGAPLWSAAAQGGAAAVGGIGGKIEVGQPADLVVLDENSPALAGHDEETVLDALLIAGSRADLAAVYIGGQERVEHGELLGTPNPQPEFDATVRRLLTTSD